MNQVCLKDLFGMEVEELRLYSMENALYSVRVVIAGKEHLVLDDRGASLIFRSIAAAKKPFLGFGISKVTLVQHSAYGEMIGHSVERVAPLETTLSPPDKDCLL
ncbi:DUF6482 family protein [Hahella ganghwensis]|uniref:DUF6482 family protein n=1 Tax=Hahella ganghwensis TaxID=286420 RepID=UPI0006880AD9|nr:DUF6482 family protein [Hahella ganghwensis]